MPSDTMTVPALVTIPDVEIIATGEWNLSTGPTTFTTEDLANAVDAAQCPAVGDPVIKLGHVDPRFDGEPAVGHVANLTLTAEGNKIAGDMAGMPGWLGAICSSAFPARSIEGYRDFKCQVGHTHPFVLSGLALLGVSAPGVGVLSTLKDVAALYGVQAKAGTGTTWTLPLRGAQAMTNSPVMAAGITTEDVRRAYYAQPSVGYTNWITEMQLDPPQLIVCNEADDTVYRVPVTIKGNEVTFGDPVQVEITYTDIAAARGSGLALVFASAADSRAGVSAAWNAQAQVTALGDDPSAAKIKALFAIPGDTVSDSKLPHHDVSDGTVGAANADGVTAAIAAVNGAHGGVKGVSAADLKAAYNHLAAHARAAGNDPPAYDGPSASAAGNPASGTGGTGPTNDEGTQAAASHGPFSGSHTHPHAAMGDQGGDTTHEHAHSHSGDAQHSHDHAPAASGTTRKGVSEVDFTDEHMTSLRAALGLGEDTELTPDVIVKATTALKGKADTKVAAGSGGLPAGVIAVDQEAWDSLTGKVSAAEEFRARTLRKDRDEVIAQAIRDGKFSANGAQRWRDLWDENPERTREVLATLKKNVVPVDDLGAPGGALADDEDDPAYRELFGADTK